MRAELVEDIAGRRVRLAMPIGALERVAEVNPALEEVRDSFFIAGPTGSRVWHLREVRAVLDAAAEAGGAGLDGGAIIEAIGLTRAVDLARRLINAAFSDDAPKKAAGGEAPATDTSSPPAS